MTYVKFLSSWLPKNVRLVSYIPGDRGSACIRILSSHEECYFDSSMCFRGQSDDPLFISFDLNNNYDQNMYESYDKVDTVPFVSTDRSINTQDEKWRLFDKNKKHKVFSSSFAQTSEGWIFEKMGEIRYVMSLARKAQSKLLFVTTHENNLFYPFEYVYVWVSNAEARLERMKTEQSKNSPWATVFSHLDETNKAHSKHFANPNCFCLDSYKLLSRDYHIFEQEYARIVEHFNFTNNIDRVREFVEEYNRRQRRANESLK
jgi:hypothetical protein